MLRLRPIVGQGCDRHKDYEIVIEVLHVCGPEMITFGKPVHGTSTT